jgi:hypothetical protein
VPHLASDGHVAHGRGSTGAFVDNVAFDTGGEACWLEPGVVVYQHGGTDGWYLARYDVATSQTTRVITDPADPYYGRGANTIAGGGGVWAAWLGDGVTGLYTSTGLSLPAASLLDVGPDGAIGYKPNYQAAGGGRVEEVNGDTWALTDDTVFELQLLGERRAIWRDTGAGVQVSGLPVPVLVSGGVYTPRALQVQGAWWICYYSDGLKQLVLHPFDATVGYVLTAGDAWPDAVCLHGTTVRVAWSVTLGEAAGHVQTRDIDIAVEPRTDLTVEMPPDPPDPPEPEPEPVDPPTITISHYDETGIAPCDCFAQASLGGGEADVVTWLLNDVPEPRTVALETGHTYHFESPGTYRIGVHVVGPGGSDQTETPRLITVTAEAPEPPDPPTPVPEPPTGGGTFVSTIQISEPAFLNWRYGGGQSLDPPTAPDDPNRDPFEHGRPVAGVDETGNLYQFADATYGVQSPNGRSWLSVQGDGSLEERPVVEGQEPGPWERFTREGNVLTEVPKDGATRAPVTFVQP